jgi:2-keto-4-pentenoate hydratase/2-oxohepta-3-ene-1,7-dioic acid hydratase in catechol pathway
VLVSPAALGRVSDLAIGAQVGDRSVAMGTLAELGISLEDALAEVSREVPLRAGDLVGIGPLPRGSCAAHGHGLAMHEPIAITADRLGTLRGAAVPRRG